MHQDWKELNRLPVAVRKVPEDFTLTRDLFERTVLPKPLSNRQAALIAQEDPVYKAMMQDKTVTFFGRSNGIGPFNKQLASWSFMNICRFQTPEAARKHLLGFRDGKYQSLEELFPVEIKQ